MKVKFIFNSQFCGCMKEIVELQSNVSEDDIKAMFPIVLGIKYDDNCLYEIIEGEN